MKTTFIALIFFSLFTLHSKAQAPHPQLVRSQTWGGTDFDQGLDIATDMNANVITVGYFRETVDFDPGPAMTNVTAANDDDIFIQKTDSAGNFQWVVTLAGMEDDDQATGVATDANGNIYVTGYFEGTIDFNPGPGTTNLTSTGSRDIFVMALDSSGSLLWARRFGSSTSDRGAKIAVGAGGVYATGIFRNTVDFDPGSGTTNLTSGGSDDIYILHLDFNGDLVWVKSLEGTFADIAYDIKVDANENVFCAGSYTGTIDFDPGSGSQTSQTGLFLSDGFLLKLDSNGTFQWVDVYGDPNTLGNTGIIDVRGISFGPDGKINVCGSYGSPVNFGHGPGSLFLNPVSGSQDVFIQQLDSNGHHVWVRVLGGSSLDVGQDIVTDANGNIHVVGNFRNTVDFGFGAAGHRTSAGNSDWFVLSLDSTGTASALATHGGSSTDIGSGIALDADSRCYVTGAFTGTIDFAPGPDTLFLSSVSSSDGDAFVQKLRHCAPTFATDVQSSCSGSFTWIDGMTYTSSNNTATHTLTNAAGCDSIVTLNLTLGSANSGIDVVSACDSHTWTNGVTYTSSNNTAMDTLTNAAGCDSVVTLNLTILNSNTGTDAVSACDTYTWIDGVTYTVSNNTATHTLANVAGCDSVVTLDLTILNSTTGTDVQSACDSFTWIDGMTYTASNNTATHTLTNAVGCDSVVTLDLTILNSTTGTDVQTACDTFTWIDGMTYTASNNTATHTLTNAVGCDSVVTLDLTILSSTTGTDAQTACDSFTWIDGMTYTASNNTATHTLTNAVGCDSVVTLDLTILNSTTGTDVQTACDTFTWIDGMTYTANNTTATHTLVNAAGCDSVVTLNLTIVNSTTGTDVITACDTFTWIDGGTYTSNNTTATHTLVNTAGCDSVVTLNLTIVNSTTGTDVITACDTITWIDGITYSSNNNTATHTLTNAVGCDSIVTLALTILNSTTGTDVVTACDTFTWMDGVTYTSSNNTATHTLTNAVGCDSIVTLDLTILNSTVGTDVVAACETFTWMDGVTYTSSNNTATHTLTNAVGCDSIVTLALTILNSTTGTDVVTACDTYTWIDGVTYTSSNNTATFTLTNTAGCDSLVTLDLTINTVDASVTVAGFTISAIETNADYQWIDCATLLPLDGETNQSLQVAADGDYAVEITASGCTDTSECVSIVGVGIAETNWGSEIKMYPNPTSNVVTIEFGDLQARVSMHDLTGRELIVPQSKQPGQTVLSLEKLSSGIYLVKVQNQNQHRLMRLVRH